MWKTLTDRIEAAKKEPQFLIAVQNQAQNV
jgi:hypothetical protein